MIDQTQQNQLTQSSGENQNIQVQNPQKLDKNALQSLHPPSQNNMVKLKKYSMDTIYSRYEYNDTHNKPRNILENLEEYIELTKEILQASSSLIGSILIGYLIQTITLHYVGQLNDSMATNTLGLSFSILSCCGGYFLMGVNQGIGAYMGRAYGAKNQELLQNYFSKGFALLMGVLTCFSIFACYTKPILIHLGQKTELAIQTHNFLVSILPGIFCQYIFDFLKNYCNAQEIYNLPVRIQLICSTLHVFITKYLVQNYQLQGAMISLNISLGLSLIIMLLCLIYKKVTLQYTTKNLFLNFNTFACEILSMAAPNELDVLQFEISSLLVGSLKIMPQFAAHVSFINMIALVYATPLGIGASINYLISNAIGRQETGKVKKCYNLCIILQFIFGIIYAILLYTFEDVITAFYTSNVEIQNIMKQILHIYFIGIIPDYIVASTMSILKGIGKAHETIICFVIAYYIVGIPSCIYFGLIEGYQVYGFWFGFNFSVFTCSACLIYAFSKVDWEKQVEKVYLQLQAEHADLQNNISQQMEQSFQSQFQITAQQKEIL